MIWRPVVGFEKFYEVSDDGQVRRIGRAKGTRVGKVLAPTDRGIGYYSVRLSRRDASKTVYIHHLVAAAFLGPRPPDHEINHIDYDRKNNAASNLEYVTRSGNTQHAYDNGRTRKPGRPITSTCLSSGKESLYVSIAEAARDGFALSSIKRAIAAAKPYKNRIWKDLYE